MIDRKRVCPKCPRSPAGGGVSPSPTTPPQAWPLRGNPQAEFASPANTEVGILLSTMNTPQDAQTPLLFMRFPDSSAGKEFPGNAGDPGQQDALAKGKAARSCSLACGTALHSARGHRAGRDRATFTLTSRSYLSSLKTDGKLCFDSSESSEPKSSWDALRSLSLTGRSSTEKTAGARSRRQVPGPSMVRPPAPME